MDIQKITVENYKTLVSWYISWKLPVTPYSFIPRHSYIVENICAGFLYQLDNTPMFWVEGVVSNPEIKDKELKNKALCALINKLEEIAKSNNGEMIMSSTPRSSLNSVFLSNGFKNTPENYFHLAKRI
jgi:hypothetical protein